jgi:hypothetical protein
MTSACYFIGNEIAHSVSRGVGLAATRAAIWWLIGAAALHGEERHRKERTSID